MSVLRTEDTILTIDDIKLLNSVKLYWCDKITQRNIPIELGGYCMKNSSYYFSHHLFFFYKNRQYFMSKHYGYNPPAYSLPLYLILRGIKNAFYGQNKYDGAYEFYRKLTLTTRYFKNYDSVFFLNQNDCQKILSEIKNNKSKEYIIYI